MIDRLNQETSIFHGEADRDIDTLFRPHVTVDDYRGYLIRCYGFEAPLESALALSSSLDMMLDLRGRARAGLIAQDLLRLGLKPAAVAELPLCLTVPQFRSTAEALGWMYVVERAALAHAIIRRHLMTCLPDAMHTASAYLQSAGGLLGTRWRQFGSALDEVAQHPAVADRIIASANEAFRCQRRWMMQDHRVYPTRAVV
jgi:heme oxygenase (biliverdin-IX-beta and delta-forming)